MLHGAGMESASEVFSTNVDFHDVEDPWRRRFDMAFFLARDVTDYDELLKFVQEHGYRFFVFDRETGVLLYPDMEFLLFAESRPAGLVPIYVQEHHDFAIYRVEGNWPDPEPIGARLENGIVLTGYEFYQCQDLPRGSGHRFGLYLHWKATEPISQSFKVFVHAVDGEGQLITQRDSVPVLWTHPTDTWQIGEGIVDFYSLHFDEAQGPGPYTILIGLYDPESGRRVEWLDSSGDSVSDHLVLESLELGPVQR